jgi:hypothetical protein
MRRESLLTRLAVGLAVIVLAAWIALPVFAEATSEKGSSEAGQNVAVAHGPVSTDDMPAFVPPLIQNMPVQSVFHGLPVTLEEYKRLKELGISSQGVKGVTAIEDPTVGASETPLVATPLEADFPGIAYTGWIPPDPVMAAGTTHVVLCVNSSWAIYDKAGNQLFSTDLTSWFSNVNTAGGPFDPKVIYDPHSGRWIILALSADNTQSFYLVSVSDDANPNGSWWNWALDATLDGGNPTNNWADYPGLGFDTQEAVYITSNQYQFITNAFQYAKLRILYKSQLYWVGSGGALNWWDFWNWNNQDGSPVFTWKPAEPITPLTGSWMINTQWSGSNWVSLWRLTNPLAAPPTLTLMATVAVNAYALPPDADQPGTTTDIETNTCYTQDVVFCSNLLYTGFTIGHNWGAGLRSALRYLTVNTATLSAVTDVTYGASNSDYYYPKVTPDRDCDCGTIVFSRSSSTEFGSVRYTGNFGINFSSAYIKPGEGTYILFDGIGRNRWGDYSGIWHDPSDKSIWMYGEYAEDNNTWGTWVGRTCCCVGPTRGNVDCDPLDNVNIADLTFLVAFLFQGGPAPCCSVEADVNGDGLINVADLTCLVSYLFQGGQCIAACP